jgi:orotidine-5'-phosphate decarboxylase
LENLFGITDSESAFNRLFKAAESSGIAGVVCSPHEVQLLKKHHPKLLAVTPGIRFSDEISSAQVQDQKRVLDPQAAFLMGSDFLVMGRSLTKSSNLKERIAYLSQ